MSLLLACSRRLIGEIDIFFSKYIWNNFQDPRDSLVTAVIIDEGGPIAASARQGLQVCTFFFSKNFDTSVIFYL